MKLLYISCYQFKKHDGCVEALPAYGDKFWEKYLDVFDSVYVLGEEIKDYLDNGTMTPLLNPKVIVDILPRNTNPKDFVNDNIIKKKLEAAIREAEAILIKPSSRKGMMAIKLAEKYKKPYMIELTGDLKLTLTMHKNLLKRLYAPIIHSKILRTIKNAPFGLYVTSQYLQKVYPIAGQQCGASDVFIDEVSEIVLENRCNKIHSMDARKELNIGLIGSYHDNRKGIDTAIRALSLIDYNTTKAKLNILALGTETDRKKWYNYASEYDVKDRLSFPPSCDSTQKVLEWIDTQDIIILPSKSEGLPRCIVEAMSRACPCITSDVCGIPELINSKWLHKPNDANTLSSLIIEMSNNKELMIAAATENFNNSRYFLRTEINKRRNSFLIDFRQYCEKHSEKS